MEPWTRGLIFINKRPVAKPVNLVGQNIRLQRGSTQSGCYLECAANRDSYGRRGREPSDKKPLLTHLLLLILLAQGCRATPRFAHQSKPGDISKPSQASVPPNRVFFASVRISEPAITLQGPGSAWQTSRDIISPGAPRVPRLLRLIIHRRGTVGPIFKAASWLANRAVE